MAPYIANLVGRNAVFVPEMLAAALYFVFRVGMDAEGDYTIGRQGRHIHRSNGEWDTVDINFLRRGCCVVRSGFGGSAMVKDAAQQGCHERDMSCGESSGCNG